MIIKREGDVLTSSANIIAHQVNCRGVMGAGLAKQIKTKFPKVFAEYKLLCNRCEENGDAKMLLGVVQFVNVDSKIFANCFAQLNYNAKIKQTQDEYFKECMVTLEKYAREENLTSVAIPYKMGCGLAGGNWDNEIYPIIMSVFKDSPVTLEIWEFN